MVCILTFLRLNDAAAQHQPPLTVRVRPTVQWETDLRNYQLSHLQACELCPRWIDLSKSYNACLARFWNIQTILRSPHLYTLFILCYYRIDSLSSAEEYIAFSGALQCLDHRSTATRSEVRVFPYD